MARHMGVPTYSMAEPRPHPPACSVDATARHCSGRDWEEPQKWQQVCRDDSKQWQESLCLSFQTPILTLSASPSTSCVHADTMLDACPASAPPPSWWTHRSPPTNPHLLLPTLNKGSPPAHHCRDTIGLPLLGPPDLPVCSQEVRGSPPLVDLAHFPHGSWERTQGGGELSPAALCLWSHCGRGKSGGAQPPPDVSHKAVNRAARAFGCLQKERGSLALLHQPPRQSFPPPALQPSLHCEGTGLCSTGLRVPHLPVLRPTSSPQQSHHGGTVHTSALSRLPLMKSNRWV